MRSQYTRDTSLEKKKEKRDSIDAVRVRWLFICAAACVHLPAVFSIKDCVCLTAEDAHLKLDGQGSYLNADVIGVETRSQTALLSSAGGGHRV